MSDNHPNFNNIIENCLANLDLIRIEDSNLNYEKEYYIDKDRKKYIIYVHLFNNKEELIKDWEVLQNEDIAFYLQGKKYINQDIRWDCYYLLFYSGDKMKEEEVCRIERDLFCCKKLVINFDIGNDLKTLVNQKLPITQEYYSKFDNNIVTESTFFNKIRSEIGISEDILSNDILSNIYKNKEAIEDIFCTYEVKLSE